VGAHRLTAISFLREFAEAGGLMSYGTSIAEANRLVPACARSHFPAGLYPLAAGGENPSRVSGGGPGRRLVLFAMVLFVPGVAGGGPLGRRAMGSL